MASVALSAFYPSVEQFAPGVPEPVMDWAIRESIIEFCTRTLTWREAQDAETVAAGDHPITVSTPTDAVSVAVLDVYADGRRLEPLSEELVSPMADDWRARTGSPDSYLCESAATVRLVPEPTDSVAVRIVAAYAPSLTAMSVPIFLRAYHTTAIASGALAALLAMPEKVWTNPSLALLHADNFGSRVAKERIAVSKSHTLTSKHVSMRGHW